MTARKKRVQVQNYRMSIGSIGQNEWTEPSGPPVDLPCNVYMLDSAAAEVLGVQTLETRTIFCDANTWPGNMHCRIFYNDDEWDQVAPHKTFDNTHGVKNDVVHIKKRG